MCLRFVFLLITRVAAWLRLSRREEAWKIAEILILRHQLAVLQRRRTGPTWSQFLRSQAEAILACEFFTVDLLDCTQACVLAVIEHATRRIRILGVTLHPDREWTAQQARNLIMYLGEQAHRVKF